MEISKTFTFEASHMLPKHPGKCSRLHGHSWKLTVYVKGPVNKETGFVMDYAVLKDFVTSVIIDDLDHRHLGQWHPSMTEPTPTDGLILAKHCVPGLPIGFYPSSENLIIWIATQLGKYGSEKGTIPVGGFPWSKLELDETCTSKCILTREEYEATKHD